MMEFCGVCGECVGYIFVTRNKACVALVVMRWMCGLHFVTRDGVCVAVVVGRWMCGFHFCNPRKLGRVVGGWVLGCIL